MFSRIGYEPKKKCIREVHFGDPSHCSRILFGVFFFWLKCVPSNYARSFQHRCKSRREGKINSGPYGVQVKGFWAKRH